MDSQLIDLKVLVIDDDPCILDMLEFLLSDLGLRNIHTHTDAREALGLIDRASPGFDVVLCDLDMPNMDGIEFLRYLADSAYAGAVGVISGTNARVIAAVEKLALTHNLNFLGYVEKHALDASVLATLLKGLSSTKRASSRIKKTGFQEWEIRRALAGGEICVYYQPKIKVSTGRVSGIEALARWNHPEHGLIGPDQFIEAAEKYALIDQLGYYIAERSINDLGRWCSQGHDLGLSINLSAKSLYSLELPSRLIVFIENAGVEPARVTLEITESQVLEELSAPMEILTRLCLRGIGLSIDDFGTGYASLEQLNRLPFSELKIDQSFVQNAPDDEAARIILESSVSMAKRLGMKVVAEGVENKRMWDIVCQLDCDEIQGFHIAKPMPGVLLGEWLDAQRSRHLSV